MVKNYVLDTNILLQNADAIYGFADNNVIITGTTLQELDGKKNDVTLDSETRYNIRETSRILDELNELGDLSKGVKLPNGGTFWIENETAMNCLPKCYNPKKADNQIIATCVHLTQVRKEPVVLVSNDTLMRISASIVLGPKCVENYKNVHVGQDDYTGHIDANVKKVIIDELYSKSFVTPPKDVVDAYGLCENEFVTLHSGSHSAMSIYRGGKLELIKPQTIFGGTTGMNAMQHYAIWALTQPADKIPLVIMIGPAGTAKTYLSLAAGLEKTFTSQDRTVCDYNKMMISRPNSEAGDAGFGYLPGDLDDKMGPLLAPYYDNLESLFMGHTKKKDIPDMTATVAMQIEELFETKVIECCALSYIRGRSINRAFMICDEAQNASKKLIKDVITRAGNNTKIVLSGDPEQCDNPKLDSRSNGLVHAAKAYKGNPMACIIHYDAKQSVRSPLAKSAIELM